MDVVIFEGYKGKGYGKKLMAFIMDHELLKRAGTIALKTKDAHGLYAQFGFERVGNSPLWMAKDNIKLL
jgi:GNAT superfamily N-acetyltransferase